MPGISVAWRGVNLPRNHHGHYGPRGNSRRITRTEAVAMLFLVESQKPNPSFQERTIRIVSLLCAVVFAYSVVAFPWQLVRYRCVAISLCLCLCTFAFFLPRPIAAFFARMVSRLNWKSLFLLALGLRLAWVAGTACLGKEQVSDFARYDEMAVEILKGMYLISPEKPTGTPLFLAAHYLIFGHHPLLPLLSIALLSSLQVLLIYGLTLNVLRDKAVALAASFLLAVWPEHVLYTNLLGSDVLFSFCILSGCWLLSFPGLNARSLILAGFLVGLSHWIRPTAPIFLAAAAVFTLSVRGRWPRRVAMTALLTTGFLAAVTPIIVLNQRTLGVPSPLSSQQGGWSLLVGTNTESHGQYNLEDSRLLNEEMARRQPRPDENPAIFQDRVARDLALERIRTRPLRHIQLALCSKIPTLWGSSANLGWSLAGTRGIEQFKLGITWASTLYYWAMLLLATAAIFSRRWPRPNSWNALTVYGMAALAITFVHAFMEVQPRYHFMFLPFLAILAATQLVGRAERPFGRLSPE
jgi:4-amino-4-deoxy-L-arabinose transferase-like glycosyltransferase